MNDKLKYYLTDFLTSEEGAPEELIEQLQKQLDFTLPKYYIRLMKEFNGGEGGIGDDSWLSLFPIDDLIQTNEDYHLYLMQYIPNYYLFGKDAADTGYAFHKQNETIHSFGLMSNFKRTNFIGSVNDFKTDSIEFCGNNFIEFIEYLYYKK